MSHLFTLGMFRMHSGDVGRWKIECDALTDSDMECLALMLSERLGPFDLVEGVPMGGLRLADALSVHSTEGGALLIADDVLTTGVSMEEQRDGRDCIGAVVFARGPCPSWITPLFSLAAVPSETE